MRIDGHHPPALIELQNVRLGKQIKQCKQCRLNYAKCDYEKVKSELKSIDWLDLLRHSDVDLAVEGFYEVINDVILKYTPLSKDNTQDFPT